MKFKEYIKLSKQEQQKYFEEYKAKWLTASNSQPPTQDKT